MRSKAIQMASTVYKYFFVEIADKRVEKWFFMKDPFQVIALILFYLLSIKVILPAYMENRKPYKLKNLIIYYNTSLIFGYMYLVYGLLTSGWTTYYTLGCQNVDFSNSPMGMRMLHFCYLNLVLKIIELFETAMFILRKKYQQVSILHVYHHASTVFVAWVCVKYIGGGMATFSVVINACIHVIMYIYYTLSALGPEWQQRLTKWKSRLTKAQLIQFAIMLVHASQVLRKDCKANMTLAYVLIPDVIVLVLLFSHFYWKTYLQKRKIS